jgi:hypothetical protein
MRPVAHDDDLQQSVQTPPRYGWTLPEFTRLIGLEHPALGALPPELRPQSVRIGREVVVIEPPERYLRRLARHQLQQAKRV